MSRIIARSESIFQRSSRCGAVLCLVFVAAVEADATNESSAGPLDQNEAAQLAVEHQPLLEGFDAQARAAREASVSAAQLPDPQLFGGIQDLPIDSDEAFSLRRDSDTQVIVGVSQEFPRAQKRRLRGEEREREAQRLDADRAVGERAIRRDASLAWLELWREDRAAALASAALHESELQERATEISAGAAQASQADLVMAQLNVDRRQDDLAAREAAVQRARNALYRWIGDAAARPVMSAPPVVTPVPNLDVVLEQLRDHPELVALQARVNQADVRAQLADAAHSPDWRVELGYGNRREYSDMVLLKVGMDLPFFTRNRQDRDVASALASRDAAQAQWQDGLRQLESEVRRTSDDLESLTARVKYYDDVVTPKTDTAVEAALAAWRSGRGSLTQVLDARRAKLEVQLMRLDLVRDAARRRIELSYLTAGVQP